MKEKNTALLLSQAKGDTIGFCLEKICLNPKGFDERLYNSEPKIGSQIRLEYEQGLYSLKHQVAWQMGLPWWLRGQNICLLCRRPRFDPCVRKIHWRRKWQPTPVLLPGKSLGWRSLIGYSPWCHKESDTTERLDFHFQHGRVV